MNSEFAQALHRQAETLKGQSILASGGSLSSLMLHLACTLEDRGDLKVCYLQFEHYNWLEREKLRQLVKTLSLPYEELPCNLSILTGSPEWRGLSRSEKYRRIWQEVDQTLAANAVGGWGWGHYERISSDLNLPGREERPSTLSWTHLQSFYTTKLWSLFLSHPASQVFFDHWSVIPFENIRYWQDFVFKKIIPSFQPCEEWKLEDLL